MIRTLPRYSPDSDAGFVVNNVVSGGTGEQFGRDHFHNIGEITAIVLDQLDFDIRDVCQFVFSWRQFQMFQNVVQLKAHRRIWQTTSKRFTQITKSITCWGQMQTMAKTYFIGLTFWLWLGVGWQSVSNFFYGHLSRNCTRTNGNLKTRNRTKMWYELSGLVKGDRR